MTYKDFKDEKAYWKRRYQANRAWIDQYKLEQGCADCEYREHPTALEFDHIEPCLYGKVSSLTSAIEEEIQRCEVVCANCHAIRGFERGQFTCRKAS